MKQGRDGNGDETVEDAFFARSSAWEGTPLPDDYVDPELTSLPVAPNPLQPALLMLLAAFAAFLLTQYVADARYALSSSEAVRLGEAELLPDTAVRGRLALPDNRYVRLTGITERHLTVGTRGYAKLVGVPIYVEVDAEVLAPPSDDITFGELVLGGSERHVVEQPGRLVSAAALPRRQRAIFAWYSRSFGEVYCDVPAEPAVQRHHDERRSLAEMQLELELGRAPTEAELTDRAGPPCTQVWLLQEGRRPADHRRHLAFVGLFVVIIAVSGWLLVRWIREYRAANP